MVFCVECGKKIPDDSKLCPYCGTPRSGKTTESKAPSVAVPFSFPSKSGFDALSKDQKVQQYWLRRLIAYVIDAVLLGVVIGILFSVIVYPILFGFGAGFQFYQPYALFGFGVFPLLWGILCVLYFTFADSRYGGSLGKLVMGLKVSADDGATPTIDKAFTRNISKIHWALLLLDLIVGLATGSDYRKKFTDKYAKTIVTPK